METLSKKHPLNFCFVSSLIQKKPGWVIFSPSHRVRIILRGELEILHRCLWRVPFNPRLETRPWQITSVDDSEIFNLKNWPIFTYIYTFSLLRPFYLGLLEMAFFFRPLWIKRSQVSKKGTCWFQDVESCWDPPSPFRTCPLLLAQSCVGTSDLSGLCQP